MHRIWQDTEFTTESLHNALQSQADAEDRSAFFRRMQHQLRHAEIVRAGRGRAR